MLKTTDGGDTWAAEPLSIKLAANWIRAVACHRTATASPRDPRPRVPHRRCEAPAHWTNVPRVEDGGRVMIPQAWGRSLSPVLLRRRLLVTVAITLMTVFFAYECSRIKIIANFIDFYPSESKISFFGKEYTIREGHRTSRSTTTSAGCSAARTS
jgi:hypothetical protein